MNRSSHAFEVRPFTEGDLVVGRELSRIANWNQTSQDWRRQYEMDPAGCFVACAGGEPIGTVTSCRYGDIAWIAMMLVAEAWRRKGVGRALMNRAIAHLETADVRTVRLDATPLGQPLYESLGFRADFELTRFSMPINASPSELSEPKPSLDQLVQLDRRAYGYDRGLLIRRLFASPGALAFATHDGEAFAMMRPGRLATFIGPCVAETIEQATELMASAVKACAPGEAFIDVPLPNLQAIQLMKQLGFRANRPLQRMTRGARPSTATMQIYATSGPENG